MEMRQALLSGIVFDIREFAVHDGPGIRTTVFLKGCPLSCSWCHNPEGISREPQAMRGQAGERVVGKRYTSEQLAYLLNGQASILRAAEGGITFSGGEPLLQAPFLAEVIGRLAGIHVLLDTSGCASEADFRMVAERSDMVYYDLKLMDRQAHRREAGVDNAPILHNLQVLATLAIPFVVRVPLVPGVTDTEANLAAIGAAVQGLPGLVGVDLLPYNKAAGGKYRAVGMDFRPSYDETRPVNVNTEPFRRLGVQARVR
ncbi:MAG: radical SAM protein [Chloroflexi bacterium]|nr:radical SAM protein [Chloroflexota bacterium]